MWRFKNDEKNVLTVKILFKINSTEKCNKNAKLE